MLSKTNVASFSNYPMRSFTRGTHDIKSRNQLTFQRFSAFVLTKLEWRNLGREKYYFILTHNQLFVVVL